MTCPVTLSQAYTNCGSQIALASKLYILAPTIYECSVWNIHYLTILLLRIFMRHIDILKSLDDGYLVQN